MSLSLESCYWRVFGKLCLNGPELKMTGLLRRKPEKAGRFWDSPRPPGPALKDSSFFPPVASLLPSKWRTSGNGPPFPRVWFLRGRMSHRLSLSRTKRIPGLREFPVSKPEQSQDSWGKLVTLLRSSVLVLRLLFGVLKQVLWASHTVRHTATLREEAGENRGGSVALLVPVFMNLLFGMALLWWWLF